MPELPDVEQLRSYCQHTALGRTINAASVLEQDMLEGTSPGSLEEKIAGRSFSAAQRHGKYCFLSIAGGGALVLHFGMSGGVRYFKVKRSRPQGIRLAVKFDNDFTLAVTSRRKLGQIGLCRSIEQFIDAKGLGPDALAADLDADTFRTRIDGARGTLKSWLMKQEHIAGIGNVYSDEILFQERLHPKTPIRRLGGDRLGAVFATLRSVLETAVEAGGEADNLPAHFLTRHRDKADCPVCGGKLEKIEVAGRSARYCPSCQPG